MNQPFRMLAALTTGCCLAVIGCGARPTPTVTGSVSLDGRPLAGALVMFKPDEPNLGENQARTNSEGKFELPFQKSIKASLKPGKYNVLVSLLVDKKGNPLSEDDFEQAKASGVVIEKLTKYNNPEFPHPDLKVEI